MQIFDLLDNMPMTTGEYPNWEQDCAAASMNMLSEVVELALYSYPVLIVETDVATINHAGNIIDNGLIRYIAGAKLKSLPYRNPGSTWDADILAHRDAASKPGRILDFIQSREVSGLRMEYANPNLEEIKSMGLLAEAYANIGQDIVCHRKVGIDKLRTGAHLRNPVKPGQRLILLLPYRTGYPVWRQCLTGDWDDASRHYMFGGADHVHAIFKKLLDKDNNPQALYLLI